MNGTVQSRRESFRARAHSHTRACTYYSRKKKKEEEEEKKRKDEKRMSLSVLRIACVISDVIYDYHHAIVGQLVHLLLNYSDVT